MCYFLKVTLFIRAKVLLFKSNTFAHALKSLLPISVYNSYSYFVINRFCKIQNKEMAGISSFDEI